MSAPKLKSKKPFWEEKVSVHDDKIPKEWFYFGKRGMRSSGINYPYNRWEIAELKKCLNGFDGMIYFIKNYIRIMTLKGLQPFDPRGFQVEMLKSMFYNRFSIAKIARQSGKTTATAAFILYSILFNESLPVGVVANKDAMAKQICKMIRNMYKNIPFFMKKGVVRSNEHEMWFEDESGVITDATSADSFRGRTIGYLYWDECAFVKANVVEDFMASIYPTIASSPDTKIMLSSTPNGYNHFHKMWVEAGRGDNGYVPISAKWSDVPGRGEEFKKDTISRLGLKIWRQEYECDFLGSDLTLIDPAKLATLVHQTPIRYYMGDELKIYEEYQKDHMYGICFDSATGMNQDYHGVHVIDITEFPYRQVAVFRNNTLNIYNFPKVIDYICNLYPDSLLVGENNSLGAVILDTLFTQYETDAQFFWEKDQKGVKITKSSKKIGCSTLKNLIEKDALIINDYDTIYELFRFVQNGVSFSAVIEDGNHDDLVMALVVFSYITTTSWYDQWTDGEFRTNIIKSDILEEELEDHEILPVGCISIGMDEQFGEDSSYEI